MSAAQVLPGGAWAPAGGGQCTPPWCGLQALRYVLAGEAAGTRSVASFSQPGDAAAEQKLALALVRHRTVVLRCGGGWGGYRAGVRGITRAQAQSVTATPAQKCEGA